VVNGVTWNATYWLASGTGTAGNTQAYSTDGIIWQVDQNNSSATLFSGNTGLALASRKSSQTTIAQSVLQAETVSLQTQITTLANQQIGVGQTWQNVTASRAASVAYFNTTTRPIIVIITNNQVANNGNYIYVNGVIITQSSFSAANSISLTAIVPPGASYIFSTTSLNLLSWFELR